MNNENLSGSFPWDLPVVTISPEWVTGSEQGKSSGRIATISLWTGLFWDGISLDLQTPNVNYTWRTAPLTSKVAFYIFIQQI